MNIKMLLTTSASRLEMHSMNALTHLRKVLESTALVDPPAMQHTMPEDAGISRVCTGWYDFECHARRRWSLLQLGGTKRKICQRRRNFHRSSFCVTAGRMRREEWGGNKADDWVADKRGGRRWEMMWGVGHEQRASDNERWLPTFSLSSLYGLEWCEVTLWITITLWSRPIEDHSWL